jgi:hypothetical protein
VYIWICGPIKLFPFTSFLPFILTSVVSRKPCKERNAYTEMYPQLFGRYAIAYGLKHKANTVPACDGR